jgi:hypothetical protein
MQEVPTSCAWRVQAFGRSEASADMQVTKRGECNRAVSTIYISRKRVHGADGTRPQRVEQLKAGGPEGYPQLAGRGFLPDTANCRLW